MTPAYKRYALTLLTAVYAVNLLDRSLMALLLQPIKEDLHLTDTQLGLLTGIVFGLFYATLGVPIARWADRGNRVTIASLAIGLWGLTAMSVVFVTDYVHMVFARMAAAVGEAGCKPPTYSLLGDYFVQNVERTRAMSIYWAGGTLAPILGYTLGGWLNEQYGWRMTFVLMGIPGLLLAILVKCTLVEPRAVVTSDRTAHMPVPSLREVFDLLWRKRACRHLTIALILLFTMVFGMDPWRAAFMMRSHGMGSTELGLLTGPIYGAGGTCGSLLGGYVVNRWFADDQRRQMQMCALTLTAAWLCYVTFLIVPGKYVALIMLAPLITLLAMFMAPTYTLMQRLVPDQMRATTLAAIMLLYNLIGMGLGPQIVGILSDGLTPLLHRESLRYALLIMSGMTLWSAYHFWQVGRTVKSDIVPTAHAQAT